MHRHGSKDLISFIGLSLGIDAITTKANIVKAVDVRNRRMEYAFFAILGFSHFTEQQVKSSIFKVERERIQQAFDWLRYCGF